MLTPRAFPKFQHPQKRQAGTFMNVQLYFLQLVKCKQASFILLPFLLFHLRYRAHRHTSGSPKVVAVSMETNITAAPLKLNGPVGVCECVCTHIRLRETINIILLEEERGSAAAALSK